MKNDYKRNVAIAMAATLIFVLVFGFFAFTKAISAKEEAYDLNLKMNFSVDIPTSVTVTR